MKTKTKRSINLYLAIGAGVAFCIAGFAQPKGGGFANPSGCIALAPTDVALEALTDSQVEKLLFLKQEEKLSRDVYLAFANLWDAAIFERIAEAEQRHMDAIGRVVSAFGLVDESSAEPGEFSSDGWQALYDKMVTSGSDSLEAALDVGVVIEEADIGDLKEALADTDRAILLRLYSRLLQASTNHRAAFDRAIASGVTDCIGVGRFFYFSGAAECYGRRLGFGPRSGYGPGNCGMAQNQNAVPMRKNRNGIGGLGNQGNGRGNGRQ